jgi:cytochrome c
MFRKPTAAVFATVAGLSPAAAQDAHHGEVEFRKCEACHAVIADDGTVLMKGGKIGPNLYGIMGRQIGTYPGFEYSADMVAAGADGTVWDEAMMIDFLHDTRAWITKKTGNPEARIKMAFREGEGAPDVAAYLSSVSPKTQ